MGFWDSTIKVGVATAKFLGNTTTVVAHTMEKQSTEIKDMHRKLDQSTDEELFAITQSSGFLSHSSKEKSIAQGILRKRGYNQ